MSDQWVIEEMNETHAPQVAVLHCQGIPTGFISSLGNDFVTSLYQAIASDENSFGLVAIEQEQVIGFATFTKNLNRLYKHILLKKPSKFFLHLCKMLFSLQRIKRIFENIFYPGKTRKLDLPDAELMSIVIAPQGRGKGVAQSLIEQGGGLCRKNGINQIKLLVAKNNTPANKLYLKCGFELVQEFDSHGVLSYIYVKTL